MLDNLLNKKRYLVVDDYGDMRSALRSMLSLFGVTEIDNAKNGIEAIHKMEFNKYDVVLCDYNLGPGQDGQQVLEEARHRKLISIGTAFIMITAENTSGMVMGAIEYEPDSYLYKPFTKDLLRSRLEKVLTKKADLKPIEQALEKKDYPKAILLLDQRIDNQPKNLGELLRLKAETCLRSGADDEAAAVYDQVLAVRELTWARMGLGKVQYNRKEYETAKQTFQNLIEANAQYTAAYDWLARCMKALGDLPGSQEVLANAIKLSPKAILRQQELGEIAMENKDFNTAEIAFNQAVKLGRHSIHKHPKIYVNLAESKVSNDENKSKIHAFKVIEQMRRDFRGDKEAEVYAALTSTKLHRELGNETKALESMIQAEQLFDEYGAENNPQLTLTMAKLQANLGNEERAKDLFQTTIKNNHDDDEFLRNVEKALNESGMTESASELIATTRREIIALNNKGVGLVSNGNIEEAIGLFEQAADGMSGNKTINLNAAKVMIMHMERHGLEVQYLAKARQYLERVQQLDPDYKSLPKLLLRLNNLTGEAS